MLRIVAQGADLFFEFDDPPFGLIESHAAFDPVDLLFLRRDRLFLRGQDAIRRGFAAALAR